MHFVFRSEQPTVTGVERMFKNQSEAVSRSAARDAAQGNSDAQFHLGLQCASDGPGRDYSRAMEWYSKAAEQNHPLAQFNLGVMYSQGQGVTQNEGEAEIWFGKSARLGDAGAQHRLGLSRYRASLQGLPDSMCESRIEAYKWFALAAATSYHDSESARDTVALKMSRADVLEATERVAAFMRTIQNTPAS